MLYCLSVQIEGVDGYWCALWSSKPVRGVSSLLGRFDSYVLPPIKALKAIDPSIAFFYSKYLMDHELEDSKFYFDDEVFNVYNNR
jgi:hypothetical protein